MKENILKTQIIEWAKNNLGNSFVFRENQLKVIYQILNDKLNKNVKHHIVEAPTGTGKSIINIIVAGVLYSYYGKSSYILCSDLYLYKQYIDFVDKYNLTDFKYCKGQTGNYVCQKGHCDVRCALCKMSGVSYSTIDKIIKGIDLEGTKYVNAAERFQCAKSCEYMIERFEAVNAPITIMTYQLFYFQMNICKIKTDSHGHPLPGQFLLRDYIFCDECHNIPSIIQSRCKPVINYEDLKRLVNIYNYYKGLTTRQKNNKLLNKISEEEITKLFSEYWKQMLNKELDSYQNTILLLNYARKVVRYVSICGERIQKIFGTKLLNGYQLSDKEKEIYSEIAWLQNYNCFLSDFCTAIELSGFQHTYKQIGKNCVTFGTVKEDGIIYYFLLRYATSGTLVTSATIGNTDSYKENCGYKFFGKQKVRSISLDSNFNFDKSPIFIDLEYKMNYTNKKQVVIPMSAKVNIILKTHKNMNGLIQTGSYENAKLLYNLINDKSRILLYKDNKEKERFISMINDNTNYVLMGPTLNEGIDLPGKKCSFIIIEKVPFLSLGDKYVVNKMKIFKKWYNNVAATNIIQGIGRGNRFKDDSCDIYIIDGCFKRLFSYTKQYFPKFITDRFKYIQIEDLYEDEDLYRDAA